MSEEKALATVVSMPGELERYQAQLRVADAVRSFVLAKDPRTGKYLHLTRIGKKDHVNIEVWRTIAAAAGYALGADQVRQVGDGWEADGVVRRLSDGVIVGSGSGYCDALEQFGKGKATYAIRGMAQTRAQSRAAAGVFGHIAVLIHEDISATPLEEMTDVQSAAPPAPNRRPLPREPLITPKLPKPVGQRAQLDHDAVTGEVIEAVDETKLLAAYRAAPNALARGKLLQNVPSDVADRVRRGGSRA